jgi:hypothetical protein
VENVVNFISAVLFIGFAALLILGIALRTRRLRRSGLRGKALFISSLKPVSIIMQGESVRHGIAVGRIEPHDANGQHETK